MRELVACPSHRGYPAALALPSTRGSFGTGLSQPGRCPMIRPSSIESVHRRSDYPGGSNEPMNICIITPAPPRSRKGNRVTALRWARILRDLGHRVRVQQEHDGRGCDLMVALHARRSFSSIARLARQRPDIPLIVALTGTDLYDDIHTSPKAARSLELATRLVVLQPAGIDELPKRLRKKVRVILQSVKQPVGAIPHRKGVFDVCVMGHLRAVKDPFRAAKAVRLLPATSRVCVTHVGAALNDNLAKRARAEAGSNPRYRWLGELPRWRALRLLMRSRVLVLSSKMEGGANVVSEAIAASVPLLASRIPGSTGILGPDYPGLFPVGDTKALASLLGRAEADKAFYRSLYAWCRRLTPLVDPKRERQAWARLLRERCLAGLARVS